VGNGERGGLYTERDQIKVVGLWLRLPSEDSKERKFRCSSNRRAVRVHLILTDISAFFYIIIILLIIRVIKIKFKIYE
jgi:hypothetical protein